MTAVCSEHQTSFINILFCKKLVIWNVIADIQLSHAFKGLHCGFCDFCSWIIRVKPVFFQSCFMLLLIIERVGYIPPLVLWQRSIVLSCFVDLCCYFVYIVLCLFTSQLCFGIRRQTLSSALLHQVLHNISRIFRHLWFTQRGIISRKNILLTALVKPIAGMRKLYRQKFEMIGKYARYVQMDFGLQRSGCKTWRKTQFCVRGL